MTRCVCVRCGAALSVPLARVALPPHARAAWGDGAHGLPVAMAAGTYAVDPLPSGPPWRTWREAGAEEAARRGAYAPVEALSYGSPGHLVLAPGDVRGTAFLPGRHGGGCCGIDGSRGPNLACAACGLPVGARVDDCSVWQAVRFDPEAVRSVTTPGVGDAPTEWDRPLFTREENGLARRARVEVGLGDALAHVLAASGGAPLALPPGPVTDSLGPVLAALLPAPPPTRTLALAGPGLPVPDADVVLVPSHEVTGELWPTTATGTLVPLDEPAWRYLVRLRPPLRAPARGRFLPEAPERSPRSYEFFPPEPCRFTLRTALTRLPAVREPWLRSVHEKPRGPWETY
ncbi:hypothetical protein [Streptomyces sp. DT18]